MSKLISFAFQHQTQDFYALIHVKEQPGETLYLASVMNEEHEKILNGELIVTEVNGLLHVHDVSKNHRLAELKKSLANSLSDYLEKPVQLVPGSVNTGSTKASDH
jgi:hypothetical protein